MKMPIKCPTCGDILVNKYTNLPNGVSRLTKMCTTKINHNIKFRAWDHDHEIVNFITIPWEITNYISWFTDRKFCTLGTPKNTLIIPYFDPDFSNYNKLIDKIKTYVMFS